MEKTEIRKRKKEEMNTDKMFCISMISFAVAFGAAAFGLFYFLGKNKEAQALVTTAEIERIKNDIGKAMYPVFDDECTMYVKLGKNDNFDAMLDRVTKDGTGTEVLNTLFVWGD